MGKIWSMCLNTKWKIDAKRNVFLFADAVIGAVMGLVLWLIIRNIIVDFSSYDWALCFVGYPAIFGYIGGIFYLYNHENNE